MNSLFAVVSSEHLWGCGVATAAAAASLHPPDPRNTAIAPYLPVIFIAQIWLIRVFEAHQRGAGEPIRWMLGSLGCLIVVSLSKLPFDCCAGSLPFDSVFGWSSCSSAIKHSVWQELGWETLGITWVCDITTTLLVCKVSQSNLTPAPILLGFLTDKHTM